MPIPHHKESLRILEVKGVGPRNLFLRVATALSYGRYLAATLKGSIANGSPQQLFIPKL